MLLTGFVLIVLTLSIGVDLAGMCLIPLALAALVSLIAIDTTSRVAY